MKDNVTASNNFTHVNQKHLEGVLRKRYSENIQHIFRRTPVSKELLKLHFGMSVLKIRCIFSKHLGRAGSDFK